METAFLTDFDLHLLAEGKHFRSYEKLGAHIGEMGGEPGVQFAVWAPNARAGLGDRRLQRLEAGTPHPMQPRGGGRVGDVSCPGIGQGALYKYHIVSQYDDYQADKADPYGFAAEIRPQTASKVWDLAGYEWNDGEWMEYRAGRNGLDAPISIYEVHLGSWMRVPEEGNRWLTYRELAGQAGRLCAPHGLHARGVSCRSPNIRSTAPGDIRRSAISRPPAGSARRRISCTWWTRCTSAASA